VTGSTEEAFFADIRDNPDDDTPRLVYADWLEEFGDEYDRKRAELIRVGCRLARTPGPGPERDELLRTTDHLWNELGDWLAPLRRFARGLEVSRGFVERAVVRPADLREHGETILSLAPVAELAVAFGAADLHTLVECPHLSRVGRLEAVGLLGDDGAALLGRCRYLTNLTALILHGCGIGESGLARLLDLDLSSLRTLSLGWNRLGDMGASRLVQAPLSRLEGLSLGANALGAASARALADASHLSRLTDLNLGSNYLDDSALQALAGSKHLAGLKRLNVRNNAFGLAGASALARSPYLRHLIEMDASGNNLGELARLELTSRFGARLTA
jgi:uncharacterized protein (TIGR02996 family)